MPTFGEIIRSWISTKVSKASYPTGVRCICGEMILPNAQCWYNIVLDLYVHPDHLKSATQVIAAYIGQYADLNVFTRNVFPIDSESESVVQSGTWTPTSERPAFGQSYIYSATQGHKLTFKFIGTGLWLRIKARPDSGILRARIDGGSWIEIDSYNDAPSYEVIPLYSNLAKIEHTLEIEVTDKKNANSSAYNICIDCILYERDLGALQAWILPESSMDVRAKILGVDTVGSSPYRAMLHYELAPWGWDAELNRLLSFIYGSQNLKAKQKATTGELITEIFPQTNALFDVKDRDARLLGRAKLLTSTGAVINPAKEDGNLASIKAKTDNLNAQLSTRALELGGNLASIKTNTDKLTDDSIKGLMRSIGDTAASPTNQTGQTVLARLFYIQTHLSELRNALTSRALYGDSLRTMEDTHPHKRTEDDEAFTVFGDKSIANGAWGDVLLLKNPSDSGVNMYFLGFWGYIVNGVGPFALQIALDPAITANGSATTPNNFYMGSDESSVIEAYDEPNISSATSVYLSMYQGANTLLIDALKWYPIVLKPNHNLLCKFKNVCGSTQTCYYFASWYERYTF